MICILGMYGFYNSFLSDHFFMWKIINDYYYMYYYTRQSKSYNIFLFFNSKGIYCHKI